VAGESGSARPARVLASHRREARHRRRPPAAALPRPRPGVPSRCTGRRRVRGASAARRHATNVQRAARAPTIAIRPATSAPRALACKSGWCGTSRPPPGAGKPTSPCGSRRRKRGCCSEVGGAVSRELAPAVASRGGCRVNRPGSPGRRAVGDELPIRPSGGLSSHSNVMLGPAQHGSSHHKLMHRIREWFVRQPPRKAALHYKHSPGHAARRGERDGLCAVRRAGVCGSAEAMLVSTRERKLQQSDRPVVLESVV
jgi:hypothetical protein